MHRALRACREKGLSIKATTNYFAKTFERKISGDCKLWRFRLVFSSEMEVELARHIIQMQERFYGMTPTDVRKLAFDFAEQQHVNHPFDASKKVAGEDWLNGFLK